MTLSRKDQEGPSPDEQVQPPDGSELPEGWKKPIHAVSGATTRAAAEAASSADDRQASEAPVPQRAAQPWCVLDTLVSLRHLPLGEADQPCEHVVDPAA